jgi:hypothetical protein
LSLKTVGVSSTTGEGLTDFFKAVKEARQEYVDDYRPELEKVVQERADKKEKEKRAQLDKMMKDMRLTKGKAGKSKVEDEEEVESDLEPSYDGDGQLLDPVSCGASRRSLYIRSLTSTPLFSLSQDTDEENDLTESAFSSAGVQFQPDGSAWPKPQ